MAFRWYAVHTYSGHEEKAKRAARVKMLAKVGFLLEPATYTIAEIREATARLRQSDEDSPRW